MNKKYIIIIGIVLTAIAAVLYLLISDNADEKLVVKSNDGVLTLEVPKAALPGGISGNEISINKIAFEDSAGKLPPWDIYELAPDGIKFREPAAITIDIPLERDELGAILMPRIYHVSSGNEKAGDIAEIPEEMEATFDLDDSQIFIKAKIAHFSQIWITKESAQLKISIGVPPPAEIGGTINIPVKIATAEPDPVWTENGNTYTNPRIRVPAAIPILYTTLEGAFEEKISPQLLAPAKTIFDKPKHGTQIGPGDQISFLSKDFTCAKTGKTTLQWYSFYNAYYGADPGDFWSWKTWINIPVECVEKPTARQACEDYEGGFLKSREECTLNCDIQNAQNKGVVSVGDCKCVPADDAPGCYVMCLGDACL